MSRVVRIAAVEDNRMLVDSLWAWASGSRGIWLTAVTATVDELLRARRSPIDVVLLDAALRAEPHPARNVRRLIDAGHRVLVIDGSAAPVSSTARHLGISVETARTYLKRVKAKYQQAGLRLYQGGPRRPRASRLAGGAGPRQVFNKPPGHHDPFVP